MVIPGVQQGWEGELLSASEGAACAQKELLSGAFLRWAPPQVPPPVADHLPPSRAILGPAERCRMPWCKRPGTDSLEIPFVQMPHDLQSCLLPVWHWDGSV